MTTAKYSYIFQDL